MHKSLRFGNVTTFPFCGGGGLTRQKGNPKKGFYVCHESPKVAAACQCQPEFGPAPVLTVTVSESVGLPVRSPSPNHAALSSTLAVGPLVT